RMVPSCAVTPGGVPSSTVAASAAAREVLSQHPRLMVQPPPELLGPLTAANRIRDSGTRVAGDRAARAALPADAGRCRGRPASGRVMHPRNAAGFRGTGRFPCERRRGVAPCQRCWRYRWGALAPRLYPTAMVGEVMRVTRS